jgi:hypothetical protein
VGVEELLLSSGGNVGEIDCVGALYIVGDGGIEAVGDTSISPMQEVRIATMRNVQAVGNGSKCFILIR